jgi:hypothetical protein
MTNERRRKGRLSFERFSGEIRSGKDGAKAKYDKVSLIPRRHTQA